jgi:hypothetical protein
MDNDNRSELSRVNQALIDEAVVLKQQLDDLTVNLTRLSQITEQAGKEEDVGGA